MALKKACISMFAVLLFGGTALASESGELCPEILKGWIFEKKPVHIVDVQTPADFAEHNYEGSVSAADAKVLEGLARGFARDETPVVVVSSRGGEDAAAAVERLKRGGVPEKRILILEGGMEGALASSGSCDCCKVQEKPR